MSEIPEHIMEQAKAVRDRLCMDTECKFDRGCGCLEAISAALLAAEKRGKEEAAKIAERDADWSRFGKGEIQEAWEGGFDAARDYRLGIVAGRAIAAAIRGS